MAVVLNQISGSFEVDGGKPQTVNVVAKHRMTTRVLRKSICTLSQIYSNNIRERFLAGEIKIEKS